MKRAHRFWCWTVTSAAFALCCLLSAENSSADSAVFIGTDYLYGVGASGSMSLSDNLQTRTWSVDYEVNPNVATYSHVGFLSAPEAVASGWLGFKHIFSGGQGIVYAIANNGNLYWYEHIYGTTWQGGWAVSTGWQNLKTVFSGGDGIIYAITQSGEMRWFRHYGYQNGGTDAVDWYASGGYRLVGSGWNGYAKVFPAFGGVIYAIAANGDLWWNKHLGRETGDFNWAGWKQVGWGWNAFTKVFPGDRGNIYGVTPDGTLNWYTHTGQYEGSSSDWTYHGALGSGWNQFAFVFADIGPNDWSLQFCNLVPFCW